MWGLGENEKTVAQMEAFRVKLMSPPVNMTGLQMQETTNHSAL